MFGPGDRVRVAMEPPAPDESGVVAECRPEYGTCLIDLGGDRRVWVAETRLFPAAPEKPG